MSDIGPMDGNDRENTRVIQATPMPTDAGPNAQNEGAWTFGVLNRCGVALFDTTIIQGNTPFQHQDRFTFSPLPTNPVSLEGAALLAIIVSFMKTPQGQDKLARLMNTYIKTCGDIISSVQDACHSNWLTALNNQHITASICHRIGLMDDASYIKTMDHYRSVFDKMFALNIVQDTISGVTTLVQGTKITSGGGETGTAESSSGLGALANIAGLIGKAAVTA